MGNGQGWIVFLLLGASALSWVFGKIKEKAEAEEAKKRAQLHGQQLKQQSSSAPRSVTQADERVPLEQQATQRKQQLALLRQERLAKLRAEMAARLQSTPQARQTAPTLQQPTRRPGAGLVSIPSQHPQQPHTNVATMRKPPSVSHDRSKLANLGTHTQHADHEKRKQGVHRLVTDAESPPIDQEISRSSSLGELSSQDWRQAIILSELLAPPVALRGEA